MEKLNKKNESDVTRDQTSSFFLYGIYLRVVIIRLSRIRFIMKKQGEHSRIQYKLCEVINQITEPQKIACAFPKLRCTFEGRSKGLNY